MQVGDTSVLFVHVRPLTSIVIMVSFDVVIPGYVVSAYQRFKLRISTDSSNTSWITYRDVAFVPDPSSLQSVYYVAEDEMEGFNEGPVWHGNVAIIVAIVFAAAAAITVATVVCVSACVRIRRRYREAQNSSYYKLLPASRSA